MALPTSERYRRNLAALTAFQPSVAAVVEAAPVPDGVRPAVGRDGTPTLRIPNPNGRLEWFGQSSMPTVSAEEMFCNSGGDMGNVSLPGILSGVEPLTIARRIPPHRALFVLEENPRNIKLAMHLHDYTELFTTGRLVFVLGDDLASRLTAFFEAYVGFELPSQMFNVPQRSGAQIADLQRRLELAGEDVVRVQTRTIESCAQALRGRAWTTLPSVPRIAVLSVDASPISIEHARRVQRALVRLGWPHEVCVPDAPGKCHVAARLRAVERASADCVLFINSCPGRARSWLPDELAVASWYLPGTSAAAAAVAPIGPRDVFFASSPDLAEALTAVGIPSDVIERCEVGADETIFRPFPRSEATPDDIVVPVDLPDDRPEACNITLPSHIDLWRALQDTVARNVDGYRDDLAVELLEEAQRRSGTTLREAPIREHFVHLLRTRIAPAVIGRTTVRVLVASGHRPSVWGANWPTSGIETRVSSSALPAGEALNRVFNAARTVLIPFPSDGAVQLAVDALAAGATVILHMSNARFTEEYPGLASLQAYFQFYASMHELHECLGRSTAGPEADAARRALCSKHTVADRLVAIVNRLRARQAAIGGKMSRAGVTGNS